MRGSLLASLLLALGAAPSGADPLDTLRAAPVQTVRSQLARFGDVLALYATLTERPLAELAVDVLSQSPEGTLVLAFLQSNAPKAVVVDLAVGAGGGSTAGAISGEATAAITARVVGDYCDIAAAGLSIRGDGGDGGAGTAGGELRANAGFCFWRGLYAGPEDLELEPGSTVSGSLFPLRMSGEVAVNASPRFTGLRNQPRRRYSEARYGFAVEGLRYMPSDPRRGLSFIYFAAEQRWEWPGDFSGKHGFELDAGFGFFRVFRTRGPEAIADRAIDIIDFRLHGTRFDETVALVDVYPLRLHGIGLGTDRVLLDADLGVTGSDGTISSTDCIDGVGCVEEVITTGDNVAKITTWAAQLGLSIGTRSNGGGVQFQHRLDSNILGQLAVEGRTTAWYQRVDGPLFVRAEAFGGNATHYLDVDARGHERFAGGSLDARYVFRHTWWFGAQVEVLQAFARDPVLEDRVAGSGVRAFATFGRTFELSRREVALPPLTQPKPEHEPLPAEPEPEPEPELTPPPPPELGPQPDEPSTAPGTVEPVPATR